VATTPLRVSLNPHRERL